MSGIWQDLNLELGRHESKVTHLGDGQLAMLVLIQLGALKAIDASLSAHIELDVGDNRGPQAVYPLVPKMTTPSSSRYITAIGTHFDVRITDVRGGTDPEVNHVRMKYRVCPLD